MPESRATTDTVNVGEAAGVSPAIHRATVVVGPTRLNIAISKLRPLQNGLPPLPPGWLTGLEAKVLYTTTQALSDDAAILEIGSWVGKSSCCIAYGIRDSARNLRYDIVDFGIAGIDEWHARFGGNVLAHKDAKKFLDVICVPGGTAALLKQNLVDRDLNKHVSLIILGDVANYETRRRYDFIFCDATHGEAEIKRNIPRVSALLKEEFVLICDDVHTENEIDIIGRIVGADQVYMARDADQYSKLAIFTRGEKFRNYLADH